MLVIDSNIIESFVAIIAHKTSNLEVLRMRILTNSEYEFLATLLTAHEKKDRCKAYTGPDPYRTL